jgi:Zn-dependent protease with chaperone function
MAKVFVSKTNRAFYQTALAIGAALLVLFFASLKAYQISSLYIAVLIHKIKDACGCENMAQFFSMHPDIFRAVILFGVGIGIFVLYSLYKLVKLILRTKKYTRQYLSSTRIGHSAKLKSVIRALDLDSTKIIQVDTQELAAFCFGFWRPKICVSSELIDLLEKKELEAVLAHEAQHMISYEPLKLFIVKYFCSIFFFLPGLKTSTNKYIILSELAADENASDTVIARSKLASAILKISEQEEQQYCNNNQSLSFFSSTIYERVNRLSDETYIPKFKFLDKSLIVGSLGLAVASFVFIFVFSTSTKALEMHNIANCVAPVSAQNDIVCSPANNQNILSTGGNIFQNQINSDLNQQPTCESH